MEYASYAKMNELGYYSRQKESWTESEVQQLRSQYLYDKMTVSQMSDICRRTPGSVAYKLKNLGFIDDIMSARGYGEYRTSDLYKEIIAKGNRTDLQKKDKADPKNQLKIKLQIENSTSEDIRSLKDDIQSLKKDMQEILSILHAAYEFE
jgi:hypothetical protein